MSLPLPTVDLFGFPLVSATRKTVCGHLLNGARHRIAFLNADCVNQAATNDDYSRAVTGMDALLPDGSGLTLAAAMQGQRFEANLNGTDLFPVLCAEACRQDKSIFMLGGRPGVAEEAARRSALAHPGLRIAGTAHGYFDPEQEDALIARINASGADILLVAFGAPHQELFIERHAQALSPALVMGVGGLLDFIAGRVPRAPRVLRGIGMEWAWRLLCEPRRLAKRYLVGNPVFIARAIRAAMPRISPYLMIKRATDALLCSLALLALAPFFALLAAAIRMDSHGSAFFVQTRVGQGGRTFRMIKFRTMHADAERRLAEIRQESGRTGLAFKMTDDPRMTKIGRWLRRTSLDELPQLVNVLKGEMSLVGPRPALPREVEEYGTDARRRLDGAPGITCLWQIAGRADLSFDKQVELDVAYLRSRSTLLDMLIIALTPIAMVTRRGAY